MRWCCSRLVAAAMLISVASAHAGDVPKKLYRWTDAQGVVHFSDDPPPSVSRQERAVLQPNGRVERVLPRELTPEEAEAKATAERIQQQREAHDRSLLATYPTAADLQNARDDHLATIDKHIKDEQKAVGDAQTTLAKLHEREAQVGQAQAGQAQTGEADQKARKDLDKQIASFEQTLADHSAALARLKEDREQTIKQFDADLQRFQELKQNPAVTQPQS